MVDLTQILLTMVITTLTILLVVIGIQVVKILQELRKSLEKVNKILDDATAISGSITKPIVGFSGFFDGFKDSVHLVETFLGFFLKKKGGKGEAEEEENE